MPEPQQGQPPEFDPTPWLEQEFSRCWGWIEAALDTLPFRTHEREHVREGVLAGRLMLWPTPNSVCLTQVDIYPTGVKVLTGLVAGGDLDEIKHTVEKLTVWAREAGCHYFTTQGRSGWERALPGFKRMYVTAYKEL